MKKYLHKIILNSDKIKALEINVLDKNFFIVTDGKPGNIIVKDYHFFDMPHYKLQQCLKSKIYYLGLYQYEIKIQNIFFSDGLTLAELNFQVATKIE